ncbi:MAG: peptide chain release factor N(5)-glutamine methyltransferase [Polyangiaceae bacterium]
MGEGARPSDVPQSWTIGTLVKWATDDFRARGIESPRLDAELIVGHALGLSRTEVIMHLDRPLEPAELSLLRELVKRRRAREPMAYLKGQREFFGRWFAVDKRVLVPRPDTEVLLDVALRRTHDRALSCRTLDLCTGSGCIAITLSKERPTTPVLATDISEEALTVARANRERLGAYRVAFAAGDLWAAVPAGATFDLVVSNPPYIPSGDIEGLMPDVRDFEPRLALDGGSDGLDFLRRIVQEAPKYLAPGGILAVELGAGEAPAVRDLFLERGFEDVEVTKDLARIERVVSGRRPASVRP